MTYYAYLKQSGKGCDYTIGCGNTLVAIDANDEEQAMRKLENIIRDEYSSDDKRLEKAIMLFATKAQVDLDEIYGKYDAEIEAGRNKDQEATERAQLRKLRIKYPDM